MAKITDPDDISVGTELAIDTSAKTFTLSVAGNLVAKDGVTLQALYSKFVELWGTSTYNRYPFPIYAIDARSGQFVIGFDGSSYNGWKPANDATRSYLRDAGWDEYSSGGVLNREYVGVVSLGDLNSGAQPYYQRSIGGSAANFGYTDEVNEAVQVYGDASNGNFDQRTYFKAFVREASKKYQDSSLTDIGETETGAYKIQFPLSNEDDLKIQANDATVAASSPYTGITVTYYNSDQNRTIGGVSYPFRIIIEGNSASAEDIYTKIQYLLRQNSDIDSGAGSVIGKTADALLTFVGDNLITSTGVYIDNFDADDINRITFTDKNGVERNFPFTSTGNLLFNSFLTAGGTGYYRMYFTDLPGANDYGLTGAITVQDSTPADIAGTITGASIPFTFDYESNVQGSRTANTDAAVTIVAGNPGSGKPTVTTATITRATGISISLVAEQDRAYTT